jgi:hypothetical protein
MEGSRLTSWLTVRWTSAIPFSRMVGNRTDMVACANEYSYMSNEIGINAWSTANWEDLSQETHVISSVSFGR